MPRTINISHNTHFIVQNINGSSGHKRSNESWIKYYRRVTKSRRTRCCVLGCSHPFEVGAHVRITDKRRARPRAQYIAPFCKSCNHTSVQGELALEANVVLISATKKPKVC